MIPHKNAKGRIYVKFFLFHLKSLSTIPLPYLIFNLYSLAAIRVPIIAKIMQMTSKIAKIIQLKTVHYGIPILEGFFLLPLNKLVKSKAIRSAKHSKCFIGCL